MPILCPLSNQEITDPVIAPDGFTYQRIPFIKYIRKYKKSPITGEPLDGKTLIYDKNYDDSKEDIAERYLDNIRTEIDDYIKIKKHKQNFEKISENFEIYLKKNSDNTWCCYAEYKNNPDMKLSERILKTIQYNANAMYFYIVGDNTVYSTINNGNGKLKINGSNKINQIYDELGKVLIYKFSSYTKEFCVKRWINNICADEIISKPIRILLGLDENTKTDNYNYNSSLIEKLNDKQKDVFSINNYNKIQIIEGPPGTGKTTVISTLLKINNSDNHYTIVISEKNRGVDAVAEKLNDEFFYNTISFGSDNIGEKTEEFLIENKINKHHIILKYNEELVSLENSSEQKLRKLKRLTYNIFPRNVHKDLKISNIGFIRYRLNNYNIKDSNKKIKIYKTLDEIDIILKEIWELKNSFNQKVIEATTDFKNKTKIILVTFGSLHQVVNFFKDDNNISLTIIVDESSTMLQWQGLYIEHFVLQISASLNNLILIGDSKQLPPYWPDHDNVTQEKSSLLDFAKLNYKSIQFTEQYRVPNDIMKILNKEFYSESPLILGHNRITENAISWMHSNGTDDEIDLNQASMIIKLLSNIDNNNILIISPYKKQCDLIETLCLQYYLNISVMTLDAVQGHEAGIVIVSMVKSTPTTFLSNKRMCVLISRAKEKLIIFGNRQNYLKSNNSTIRRLARHKELKFNK